MKLDRNSIAIILALGCLAGSGLVSRQARAQVLIQPVSVEFSPAQRTVVVNVTLSEKALQPVRLQAQLLRWQQDLQGLPVVEPTDEFLVSPAIADVQPGAKQVFRVALRGPRANATELAYRLILEDVSDVPAGESEQAAMAITFRMRYDLPVMVAPVGAVANAVRWKPCASDTIGTSTAASASDKKSPGGSGQAVCIRIGNVGNRRVKIQTVTVFGDGWQQAFSTSKGGEIVLSGAQREWHVPLAGGQIGAVRSVTVQTTHGETLQAQTGGP